MPAPCLAHPSPAWSIAVAPKRTANPTEPTRPTLIELPANERGLSLADVQRFDKAKAELMSPRLALNDAQKLTRARTMAQVENGPKLEQDRAWIEGAIAETVALHEARREEITTTAVGAKLIITHDGLWNLHERRKITIEQYEEGLAYRKDRDSRCADLGSQLGNEGGGGGAHNNNRFVANRFERAEASVMVSLIDRAVALRCIQTPASLQMLRWVAGDGHSIASFGRGRAVERHVIALVAALEVAASVRKAENERRKAAARS